MPEYNRCIVYVENSEIENLSKQAMPPVLRSFTVFQDTPAAEEAPAVKPAKALTQPKGMTRSLSGFDNLGVVSSTTLVPDKENLHPVTGERTGSGTTEKKRKDGSNVLMTKIHNPPSSFALKKHKKELSVVLKDEGSPTKKRKAAAPSEVKEKGVDGHKASKPKAKVGGMTKKDSKTASGPRKPTTSKSRFTRSRTVATLPKVSEEEAAVDAQKEDKKIKSPTTQLSQADIDSRCYALTVKPLADVSQAYEDTLTSREVNTPDDKSKFPTVKEVSAEPDIHDYYVPPIANSNKPQSDSSKSPFEEPTGSARTFSTPERRAIYAAFTFSSPSPSGERFSKTKRAGSVPIPRLDFGKHDV
ncbi:hypothetical protein AMATHDRAFT_49334 [Amanita thiersii Skay4041]|uniref:Uncharacterized protein n=1 Tax=Amanita thiersii Skay4041 TaxID=703135 RepID=A0A2A9NCC3_9AGAR|nr:hypothetical protein AMATHDRAFT_49334 [Amanita thiersii Skay4041]